jgi:hypothetical protein
MAECRDAQRNPGGAGHCGIPLDRATSAPTPDATAPLLPPVVQFSTESRHRRDDRRQHTRQL